jgi:hypothetical protein
MTFMDRLRLFLFVVGWWWFVRHLLLYHAGVSDDPPDLADKCFASAIAIMAGAISLVLLLLAYAAVCWVITGNFYPIGLWAGAT